MRRFRLWLGKRILPGGYLVAEYLEDICTTTCRTKKCVKAKVTVG